MPKKHLLAGVAVIILVILSLVLGSIPPSPGYYLKTSRETIQSLFIFGPEDKANWDLTLADKRIAEAEKLKAKGLNFLAQVQIDMAKNYQQQALVLIDSLKDKVDTNYLKDKYSQNQQVLQGL